jgi:hypothetical protein
MDASLISSFTDFLKENYLNIAIAVAIIFGALIVFSINGWNFATTPKNPVLIQEVTMESMQNNNSTDELLGKNKIEYAQGDDLDTLKELDKMNMTPVSGFCEQYRGNSGELEKACNELTTSNCNETSCCVLTGSKGSTKCVAGGADGPTYKTDGKGNLITHDYHYFQNKCYGKGCPSI